MRMLVGCIIAVWLHIDLWKKKGDPEEFMIPYTIRISKFARALCDLGANINLMPLAIFK